MNVPNFAEFDPYATLGVSCDAEFEVLKAAYRRLVRENHPDIARDKTTATARMTQLNAAWGLVGDPSRRAAFDARKRLEARERAAARHAAMRSGLHNHAKNHPNARASVPNTPPIAKTPPTPAKNVRSNPKKPGAARLEEASRLLFAQSNPTDAIELCRSVIRSDFRNVAARELMGEAYLRLNQPERASAIWEQALILQPDNVALHRRWRELRAKMGASAHFNPASTPDLNAMPADATSNSKRAAPADAPIISAIVRPLSVKRPSLWKRLAASLKRK